MVIETNYVAPYQVVCMDVDTGVPLRGQRGQNSHRVSLYRGWNAQSPVTLYLSHIPSIQKKIIHIRLQLKDRQIDSNDRMTLPSSGVKMRHDAKLCYYR